MYRERINIVDENNSLVGEKFRDEIDYQKDRYQCTGLWVNNSKGEVLIAQRKLTKKTDPGKWGTAVSGTVAVGETFESNIYKEAEEEIGLFNVSFEVGPLQKNEVPRKSFAQWFIAIVDLPIDSFVLQEEEVEQLSWVSPEELIADIEAYPDKYVSSFKAILPLLIQKKL